MVRSESTPLTSPRFGTAVHVKLAELVKRVSSLLLIALLTTVPRPAGAEWLTRSKAVPDSPAGAKRFVAECEYTRNGKAPGPLDTLIEFFVTRDKPFLERILDKQQPNAEAEAACPTTVGVYPGESSNPRSPNYGDCVLKHMQGVTSDAAAYTVKQTCMRTAETVLNLATVPFLQHSTAYFWKSPFADGGYGLFITVNNDSYFGITELEIQIEAKDGKPIENYNVRRFFEASPGNLIVGSPKDPSTTYAIRSGLHTFYVPIRQITNPPDNWFQTYGWSIIGAMGYVN